jgi:DNA polymerase-3 subunit alpha
VKNENFAHLHVHNEYSILDGVGTAEDWVEKAVEMDYRFLALTNHGNVDGCLRFQKACEEKGIVPIIGAELYIVPDAKHKEKGEQRGHVTCLVKNDTGWANLLKMITYSNLDGFYYKPRIDFPTLCKHTEGLVFMSACHSSFMYLMLNKDMSKVSDYVDTLFKHVDVEDMYLELMPLDFPSQYDHNSYILSVAKQTGLKLVATNDCHYPKSSDALTQEVLLTIQTRDKWDNAKRWKFDTKGLYLKSANEMINSFKAMRHEREDWLEAMTNTMEIVEKCKDFRIPKSPVSLPIVPDLKGKNEKDTFEKICRAGWRNKIQGKIDADMRATYLERLEHETEQIEQKGFVRYFLIVWELMEWCRKQGIFCGIGRGSVGGSLIGYLMGITNVDPIAFDLPFERFLSPDRIDYPDIDMDFPDNRRAEIRQHLEELYGEYNVAAVSTFLTIKAKMAIRDIGRVFDMDMKDVDLCSKAIVEPDEEETGTVLEAAFNSIPECQSFQKKYPEQAALALQLEGQVRGSGQHAGAVIITDKPITESSRTCLVRRKDDKISINWDYRDAEYFGLIKFDILGVKVLTILDETLKMIKRNHNVDIDLLNLRLDDIVTFKMIAKGETIGAFQIGSPGLRKVCKEMKADTFADIVAANALHRPGSFDYIQTYISRKIGDEQVEYQHELLEDITKETYGILVYQEQIMRLFHDVAEMSWSEADKARKVISKSKGAAELEKFRDAFVAGCRGKLKRNAANEIFNSILNFGSYSFNKAHAVEYTMIGYYCMFLKAHYPLEFIACSLSYGRENQKAELIEEARKLGISVMLPKIGKSDGFKWEIKDNVLYCPFIEIKGIGDKIAQELGTIKTNRGFFERENHRVINKRVEEILEIIQAHHNKPLEQKDYEVLKDFFAFDIYNDPSTMRKTITERLALFNGDLDKLSDAELRSADFNGAGIEFDLLTPDNQPFQNKELLKCKMCDMRKACKAPVLPSPSEFPVMLIAEGPGVKEDLAKEGLVGKSGIRVWGELGMYGFNRKFMHVTNVEKCYPGSDKKDFTPANIEKCYKWLDEEMTYVKPLVVLAMGKEALRYFTGKEGGIFALSGTTDWIPRWNCWVCWCIHPAAIRNDKGEPEFRNGVKNFVDKMRMFAGV